MSDAAWRGFAPGQRVVVRRRLVDDGAGKLFSDVLALVISVDDDGLRLLTDAPRQVAATEVYVPASQIETAKPIPPRPVRPRRP
ncbi:MAG: hypothetical protein FWG11_00495 [Promicromonosporaceae bacterium]|nr:hypothetical protein [Promicromonosporaceae bacterium]